MRENSAGGLLSLIKLACGYYFVDVLCDGTQALASDRGELHAAAILVAKLLGVDDARIDVCRSSTEELERQRHLYL